MEFDGKTVLQVSFECGLPQGSSRSPILIFIYAAAISQYKTARSQITTTYVDDKMMLHGAKATRFVTQALQERLNHELTRAPFITGRYAPRKCKLMHLSAGTKAAKKDDTLIRLYNQEIEHQDYVKSSGV